MLGRSIDRYLLAGIIGEGGMGAVYLAIQRPLNREVALKVISGIDATQAMIERFEREARAISVLEHPNIVQLYDYGIGELEFTVPYMALEYVKHGRTLRRALSQIRSAMGNDSIPGELVFSIFSQVLNALGTAHEFGIVHRDMKPDNVMLVSVVGTPHLVKVLDFGLAKAILEVSGFDRSVSRPDTVLGTPSYMAPEQAQQKDAPEVDGRADLYAVAVMIYEVFTGVLPFDGEKPVDIMVKKVDPSFFPMDLPEARRLPEPFREFLRKGMAMDPGDRFADAAGMLQGLKEALSGREATAVGMLAGGSGSTGEYVITPQSPMRPAAIGRMRPPEAPQSHGINTSASMEPGIRKNPAWLSLRLKVALGLALFAVAVLAGSVLMVGDPSGPQAGPTARIVEPAVVCPPDLQTPVSAKTPSAMALPDRRPAETVAVTEAHRPPDVAAAQPARRVGKPAPKPARRSSPKPADRQVLNEYPEL
jgi:serine/threonine-protein kinase